jgi:AbrB family looped-hinge helix DNA binding protein
MDVSKLTAKNQVTIPADVRQHLGVRSGDHRDIAKRRPALVLRDAAGLPKPSLAPYGR